MSSSPPSDTTLREYSPLQPRFDRTARFQQATPAPPERIPPPRTGPPAQVGRYDVAVAASVLRWDGCRLRLSLWGDRPAVSVRLASDRIVLDPEGAARGIDARRRLRLTEVEAAVLERPAPVLAVLTASGSVVLLPSSAVSGLLSAGGAHG